MKHLVTGLLIGGGLVLGGVLLTTYLGDRVNFFRPRRTVSVTGTSKVRVSPDSARITFALFKSGETIEKARQNGTKSSQEIEKDLNAEFKKHKLLRADILKTDQIVVEKKIGGFSAVLPSADFPASSADWTSICSEKWPLATLLRNHQKFGRGDVPVKLPEGKADNQEQLIYAQAGFQRLPDPFGGKTDNQEQRVYALVTYFTVEIQTTDVNILQQATRTVADVALRHKATYNRYSIGFMYGAEKEPSVVFYRQNTTVERQQALDEALTAARIDAQKLANSPVPIEVIEVSEQTPLPVVLTIPNEFNRSQGYGQAGPPVGTIQTQIGPSVGSGLFSTSGPQTAIDREIICTVVVKFAF